MEIDEYEIPYYAGPPEDLEGWQAIHQAIGYIMATDRGRSLIPGLLKAATALNRPVIPHGD